MYLLVDLKGGEWHYFWACEAIHTKPYGVFCIFIFFVYVYS